MSKNAKSDAPVCYRQGDVLILKIDAIPDTAQLAPDLVLAHGEVTGHAHRVVNAKRVKRFIAERLQYLAAKVAAKVKHEEHSAVCLPAGNYQVLIQQEYTPGALRAVMD